MSFVGVNINKLNGGLKRTALNDRKIVLISCMDNSGTNLGYLEPQEFVDINHVEAFGVNESSDSLNGDLVYYHLSEIFRIAPDCRVWLIPVERTVEAVHNLDQIRNALRRIDDFNVLGFSGFFINPSDDGTTIPHEAYAEIFKHAAEGFQIEFVEFFADEYRYIDGVFVEVYVPQMPVADGFESFDFSTIDLRGYNTRNVTFVIGQDPEIAGVSSDTKYHAAIGTALGSVAARRVHEDIGSVDIEEKPRLRRGEENFSLTDGLAGRWLSASLSNGVSVSDYSPAQLRDLTDKGWMFVGSFANYPGFYWNGCPTAVSKDSDYAYFNLNCIWNKAARLIRNTLIPRIRSKVPTDPETGYLKSTWVSGCESSVSAALDAMVAAGNIEAKDVYINPAQAPTEDTPLEVKCQLVVGRIVHEFSVDLGLTNNI